MDWSFTEDQEQIAALTRQILERELTEERMREVERSSDHFDDRLYGVLEQAGVLSEELGLIELCRVLVEVGRAVAPVPAAPVAIAKRALSRAAATVDASIPTLALAEELNLDLDRPATRAVRDGDGWILSGAKTTVPAGTIADVCVTSATLEDGSSALFAVRRGVPGVSVTEQTVTDTQREALVELDDVKVGGDHHLGDEDALRWVIDHFTVALCALQLGICERALELTAEYAKTRVQFDRPIATFQAVGQRLADAYIDVNAIRITLWQAAWRLAEGLPAAAEIATAKFWASDAGHRVAHTAVHVHGGMGIDLDYHLNRYFVAAKRIEFALGGATEQLVALGRELANEPA